jgi:ribosome-associated protein
MQDDVPQSESKSKRKRQMIALQKIGETLVKLPAAQLSKIPLESTLLTAIIAARSLTTHEAKRRQLQYIGRLMRAVEDTTPIQAALEKLELKSQQSKAQFHQMERWRDTLVSQDDTAVQEFLQQFPHADRQHLRQLIRNAKKKAKPDLELFRYVRGMVEMSTDP